MSCQCTEIILFMERERREIFTPTQSVNNILDVVLCFAALFKESDFTVSTTLGSQKMFKDIFFVKKYHIL